MSAFKFIKGIIAILITAIALSFTVVPETASAQQNPVGKTSISSDKTKNKRDRNRSRKHKRTKKQKKNKNHKQIHHRHRIHKSGK
jgi:Ni/Co efflux regulator RcnB